VLGGVIGAPFDDTDPGECKNQIDWFIGVYSKISTLFHIKHCTYDYNILFLI
jgi:hypothetical protein